MSVSILHARQNAGDGDGASPNRCAIDISMPKGHLSGIMITKDMGDEIAGTMINEFGITALSFVYEKKSQKLKLDNVIGFLDKWYIKRVLKGDIKYCLHVLYGLPAKDNKHYVVLTDEHCVTVTNAKRKISYSFSPIAQEPDETEK